MVKALKSTYVVTAALAVGFLSGQFTSKESAPAVPKEVVLPTSEILIERESYILAYDGRCKQARWVYEELTTGRVQGAIERKQFHFKEDPLIPASIRSTKEDYAGSGFDRGHLCPAADAKFNENMMEETFFLSNVSPQCPEFNRGFWSKLETHVRSLALQHGAVDVFTGGLYLPRDDGTGKRFVKYQVIGKNDVAVPTHYFKVIFGRGGSPLESYILPNEQISAETPLKEFRTTLEKVEKAAGIVFSESSNIR